MFVRSQLQALAKALKNHPSVVHVLIGPRQVGKTTLARQLAKELPWPSVYASADGVLPPGPEWIETQWQAARRQAQTSKPVLLVLDELQKVRGWSETLKQLWDSRGNECDLRVLVLASSALMMQHGLTESLTGRFFLHRCGHWAFPECRDAFGWSLAEWIYFGGYPGAAAFRDEEPQWKQYVLDSLVEPTLSRDVLQLQKVAKPALLRHLFLLSAGHPAQILSYNKMLGQLLDAGNTTTLAHYLVLLDSAFLVSGLQIHSGSVVRQRASSPKLVLWNNALVSALDGSTFAAAQGDGGRWGWLVENAVGAHLLNQLMPSEFDVRYWRDGNYEVDYVVTRGVQTWALEVKSGRSVKLSGMDAIRRQYPKVRGLLIGGNGIPLEEFFAAPPQDWLA